MKAPKKFSKAWFRMIGAAGGRASAQSMSAEARTERAKKAVAAREARRATKAESPVTP